MASLKKKVNSYLQTNILPFILQLLIRFVYVTNKKRFHYHTKMDNETFIISFWHGDLIMQPHNYRAFKPHGNVKVIVSAHRDGEAIRKTVEYLGVGALEGSSTRGGAKAMIGAIKGLKNGIDVAITPDGPKGPIYSIADGIVAIAQKTGAKIICAKSRPSKYWQMKSWDRFRIPKPFGTIDFYMSEPIDISGLEIEEAKSLIKKHMGTFDE